MTHTTTPSLPYETLYEIGQKHGVTSAVVEAILKDATSAVRLASPPADAGEREGPSDSELLDMLAQSKGNLNTGPICVSWFIRGVPGDFDLRAALRAAWAAQKGDA